MKIFEEILEKECIKAIINKGGEVYFVGGCVRDYFLSKDPKDVDIVVRKLQIDEIKTILKKFGHVHLVGESFGVIKFKEFKTKFELDIALPRKDKLDNTQKGHRAIIVQSDPFLSIEDDLKRRDFTINSFCFDQNLQVIDPFNGLEDLYAGIIKATSNEAFSEDPLRMLRAIQFAARFRFSIEEETCDLIRKNAAKIKDISKERIVSEIQKVIDKKGDIGFFTHLLFQSTIASFIFPSLNITYISHNTLSNVKTIGEYLFALLFVNSNKKAKEEIFSFPLEKNTKKEIDALQKMLSATTKMHIFEALQIYPKIIHSKFFDHSVITDGFIDGRYPKSLKELNINGDELMKLGLEGQGIMLKQYELLEEIFNENLINVKEKIYFYLFNEMTQKLGV